MPSTEDSPGARRDEPTSQDAPTVLPTPPAKSSLGVRLRGFGPAVAARGARARRAAGLLPGAGRRARGPGPDGGPGGTGGRAGAVRGPAGSEQALRTALDPSGLEATWFRTPPPAVTPAPATAHPVANLGEVLGNYRLERILGEGAMGVVFEARHARLDKQVAVKILKPQHSMDSSLVQRFFQEARAVNAINHENIVEIFDFVEEPAPAQAIPRFYYVLELLQGVSLRQLLQHETLSVRRAVHLVAQHPFRK